MRSIARFTSILATSCCTLAFTGPAVADDTPPKVTLLEAGQGDKSELRYDIPASADQTSEMTSEAEVKQSVGGMDMPAQKVPATNSTMQARVTDRTGADARFELEMEEMTVAGLMDDRGLMREVTFDFPAGTDPIVKMQMEQNAQAIKRMAVPMPEEAVGVGAKWTVEQPVQMNGIKLNQSATYTLKERKGDVLVIGVEMTQTADPQKITNPQAPQMEIQLKELKGEGAGEMTVNLKRILPVASDMETDMTIDMEVPMMGQTQTVEQSVSMTMSMKSEDAPASATP